MYSVTSWWMNWKLPIAGQVGDVVGAAGDQVVHGDDVMALGQEPVAEVAAEEAGAAGD